MKYFILLLSVTLLSFNQANAQRNVADIAHAFMRSVKSNSLTEIKKHFLEPDAAYAIMPKEAAGMNMKQKNEKYLQPLFTRFEENFENIQKQITDESINVRKMDLQSYKLEKMEGAQKMKPQAMSIFFNYYKKEYNIPVSVIQIDERWYILEILHTTNIFKK